MADKPIVIGDWHKRMGLSAHTGPELIRCLDISEYGVLRLNKKPTAMAQKSGEAFTTLPSWIGKGRISTSAYRYFVAPNGAIKYYNLTTSEWTKIGTVNSDGRGAGMFAGTNTAKDFLIFTNASELRCLDCSSYASPTFTTISSGLEANATYRAMCLTSSNRLYIANRWHITELMEVDGQTFAPGTAETFTLTPKKLGVPSTGEITSLAEMGSYLIAGTTTGELYYYNLDNIDEYPFPERVVKGGDGIITNIIVLKNIVYYQSGTLGRWYYTTGLTANKCAEIPLGLLEPSESVTVSPFSCLAMNDKIYFGAVPSASEEYAGIWSFDTQRVGQTIDPTDLGVQACIMEHKISTDYTGAITIGAIVKGGLSATVQADSGAGLLYGFSQVGDTDYYLIDQTSTYVYSASDGEYISQFSWIGNRLKKRTINEIEIQLAKPFPADYSIVLYYRTNTSASWTSIATLNTAGQTSFSIPRAITTDKIQFRMVIDGKANDSTNIEIMHLIAR